MNTEGRQPIDGTLSPVPLERLREESGLTWRKLAASAAIAGRDAVPPLRRVERLQPGPGHKGIVAPARYLPGGCDQDANPDRDGHGG